MGQGLHTKVAQVAASAFSIPLSSVFISETSTDKVIDSVLIPYGGTLVRWLDFAPCLFIQAKDNVIDVSMYQFFICIIWDRNLVHTLNLLLSPKGQGVVPISAVLRFFRKPVIVLLKGFSSYVRIRPFNSKPIATDGEAQDQ